jgi:catechol 2,3-dioxygenase-like lactoylglutathione lyase family enzyme
LEVEKSAIQLALKRTSIFPVAMTREVRIMSEHQVKVRYMVNDVKSSVEWYTKNLDFKLLSNAEPAFADVQRGPLRLLLSGEKSSAGRPMPDGRKPGPGGWNRIELVVDDLPAEVERLRARGVKFRNEIVTGPGGSQILLEDPSGNVVELFEPAAQQSGKQAKAAEKS